MSLPFLLEVGTEEIPDWMIPPALEQLDARFRDFLKASRLNSDSVRVDATPRRLILKAAGLPERQQDTEELITGPPKSAGAGAAQGFARKQGLDSSTLETVTTPKGEYFAVRKKTAGRGTRELLAEALPSLILGIDWPKTMYWTGKGGPRFIRPIRWLAALLGNEVVPFEIAGVRSGTITRGHRQHGCDDMVVDHQNYEQLLRSHYVIVSADERRRRIETEIARLIEGFGLRLRADPGLLETLVFITEYPTPILGAFDTQYLSLPDEVLVTVMRHHQKYFSVEDSAKKLAPHFIAVMNAPADPEGLVLRGNERVLRARFNDARFFWEVDQKKTLADRVADLAHVTFQARLGSYLDKTERVEKLAASLGDSTAARAARLAKCDLTTEMVKEFTELQGVVGGLYARAQGESEEVASAIYDHYKPAGIEDSIPSTPAGLVLSLADKLDTLRECFRIGLAPSGSKDPFALRRAAQGAVRVIVEGKMRVDLSSLLGQDRALTEFIADRVRYYFKDVRGFKYDEVNAVLAAGWSDLVDVEQRLIAIQSVRPTENFEPLAASFKRIKNILRQANYAGRDSVEPALLEPGPEQDLYAARAGVNLTGDYAEQLLQIASLRPAVDRFFDKVLVNAEDPKIRQNRLALLAGLIAGFNSIADFSEIVTSAQS
jgi:glycyl-tRNA synthetase beta chain